jgi:hypothetical protein
MVQDMLKEVALCLIKLEVRKAILLLIVKEMEA